MDAEELKDLAQSGETTRVQFKEIFTSETKIAQEMVAFANTHGGVILFNIDFINEEEANQFRVIIWRIKDKEAIEKQKKSLLSANTIQKNPDTIQKTIQKDPETIQKALDERGISLTEMQMSILCHFAANPKATRNDYIESHDDVSEGGVIFNIGRLQQLQLLKHVGGRKNGYWEILL